MIKLLQKKFVTTAMMAISILIILLLGAINIVNIGIVRSDIDRTLSMLTENRIEPNMPGMMPNAPNPNMDFSFQTNENRLLSSPYFLVTTDSAGNVIFTDSNNISSDNEDEIKKIVDRVVEQGVSEGKSGGYRYKAVKSYLGNGLNIAFLDTSNEVYSYFRVLFLSAAIGLACWSLMLLFVISLSKKAIRPIAENLEKQKEFITNAGHEIKTPLAIIQANTEAMELYGGENKWSKNIKQQVVRLDGLMKNLLFLTRSDEKGLVATKTDFSLSEVVSETAKSFVEPMGLKGVNLQICVQENICANADREQIMQLVSILLDNALKYTNDNGFAGVFLKSEYGSIDMQIKNTVAELPKVSPDRLFDRFYRADTARTQKTGGYGIGLSMAKAICEANNAQISVVYEDSQSISFNVKIK